MRVRQMGQNLGRLAAWVRLALVGAGAVVLLALSRLDPVLEHLPPGIEGALLIAGAGVLLAVPVLSLLHLLWVKRPRAHRFLVVSSGKVLDGLLVVIMVLCGAELLSAAVPRLGNLTAFLTVDGSFDMIWAAWENLGEAWGLPISVAGFATGPVVLLVILSFARGEVHRAVKVGATLPPEDSDERRKRVQKELGSRSFLLKAYAGAKDLLEATRKDLTFLSLDIVGSTTMKGGEDPHIIEGSFLEYRKLVEGFLAQYNAYKQTWTPDGQMAAFHEPQDAVDCGKRILLALPEFNREVSRLKQDFRLRVGANRGVVSIDDEIPLEEVSDFVIDVAGHMQKYAEVGSIWIPEFLYHELEDSAGFAATDQEVDGHIVYAWKAEEDGSDAEPE